jgi:uncharacterized protein YndB with AHSA1/START domain
MKELIVKKSIKINSTPTKVWDVLTNPKHTKEYMFGCEVISDWKIGSTLIWKGIDGKVYVKGNIVKMEYGKLLQFTTFDPNGNLDDVPSNYLTATYELIPENDHITLSVVQGDYWKVTDGEKRYNETFVGWDMILPKIKEVSEKI